LILVSFYRSQAHQFLLHCQKLHKNYCPSFAQCTRN
jgi:hypothetical protein